MKAIMLSAQPKRLVTEEWPDFSHALSSFLAKRAADGKRCLEAAIRRLSRQIVTFSQEELERMETQDDDDLQLVLSIVWPSTLNLRL